MSSLEDSTSIIAACQANADADLLNVHETERTLRLELVQVVTSSDRAKTALEASLVCLQYLTAILSRVSPENTPTPLHSSCTDRLLQIVDSFYARSETQLSRHPRRRSRGHSMTSRMTYPNNNGGSAHASPSRAPSLNSPMNFSSLSLSPNALLMAMKSPVQPPRIDQQDEKALFTKVASATDKLEHLSEAVLLQLYAAYQEQVHFPVVMALNRVRQSRNLLVQHMDQLLAKRETILLETKALKTVQQHTEKLKQMESTASEYAPMRVMLADSLKLVKSIDEREKAIILAGSI